MTTAIQYSRPNSSLIELPRADHLRDQVEGHDDQRARCREHAHRRLLEAEGGNIGEGELAEVAQPLGQQEGHHRPADQKADRIDQAVEAADHHRRGDAEERGGRHVVARDRHAVLEAGDAAAGGVEVGRAILVLAAAHLVMKSVPTTKAANMPMAVQLVGCFSSWPRSAPAAWAALAAASRSSRGPAAAQGAERGRSFQGRLGDLRRSARRTRHWRGAHRGR